MIAEHKMASVLLSLFGIKIIMLFKYLKKASSDHLWTAEHTMSSVSFLKRSKDEKILKLKITLHCYMTNGKEGDHSPQMKFESIFV